jgi:hypothetical protein
MDKERTFVISYVDGRTEIGVMPKLTRHGHHVLYTTKQDGRMVGKGSGLWKDIVLHISRLQW